MAVQLTMLELCAGAGGMTLGLERAGFMPALLIDSNVICINTLRSNRPWPALTADLRSFASMDREETSGIAIDLLAAGLPRISARAALLRPSDEPELELVRAAALLAHDVQPRALIIENLPELTFAPKYSVAREFVNQELKHLGYDTAWGVLNAKHYGVPQDRPCGFLVAFRDGAINHFTWPAATTPVPVTVGAALGASMGSNGWEGAAEWARSSKTQRVAPTVVGGSERRGGADLGPSGTKRAWATMDVNGNAFGEAPPPAGFVPVAGVGPSGYGGLIKLTLDQVKILQGFPVDWALAGGKTKAFRQLGHALPPPVAEALGQTVAVALQG